ncbi:hypothetical protein NDU88_002472 [Pleurodeles waltl]|uniref:Uncharacterized protein n=1 Tax=Pleurodeles waltl TaxID=8319 RepID=A0AAV7RAD2_PLEWA|nr:hypothetical protein NDU88_002472 [Pleurodeles waltl]
MVRTAVPARKKPRRGKLTGSAMEGDCVETALAFLKKAGRMDLVNQEALVKRRRESRPQFLRARRRVPPSGQSR